MNNAVVQICAVEAKEDADKVDGLKEKVAAAMKSARNHWMCVDADEQLQAALSAAYASAKEEDKPALKLEIDALRIMNAMFTGVPVDFEQVKFPENPIGIVQMWKDSAEA